MGKVMIQFDGYETLKKHYGKKVFAVISIEKGKDNYEYLCSEYGELLPIESRPKGKWIAIEDRGDYCQWYKCSLCGGTEAYKTNYCYNCGADNGGDE